MKITKSQLQKIVNEEIQDLKADSRLDEFFGLFGKKKKKKEKAPEAPKGASPEETALANWEAMEQDWERDYREIWDTGWDLHNDCTGGRGCSAAKRDWKRAAEGINIWVPQGVKKKSYVEAFVSDPSAVDDMARAWRDEMDSALLQADKNGKIYLDPTKGRMGALKSAVSDLKSAQGASGGGGLAACRENCRKRCEEKRAASAGTSTRRMDHEDMKNCEESCISSNCRASNFEEGTYRVGATRIKRVDVQQIIREELRAVLAERKKV